MLVSVSVSSLNGVFENWKLRMQRASGQRCAKVTERSGALRKIFQFFIRQDTMHPHMLKKSPYNRKKHAARLREKSKCGVCTPHGASIIVTDRV